MEPSPGFCRPKRKTQDLEPTLDCEAFGKGKEMFRCELCNVRCNSKALFEGHCEGKKHKAKESAIKEFEEGQRFHCDICDVWCNSEIALDVHLGGKKHKVNEAREDGIGDDPRGKVEEKAELWCDICQVRCNSEVVMAKHLNGKKHKAKEARARMHMEEDDPQSCTSNDEKKEVILGVVSDPQGQAGSKEKNVETFDGSYDKNAEGSRSRSQMNNEERKEEVVDVGCKEVREGNDPQGQNDTKENGNGKGLNCEEPKEFWCLLCRVKCDSRAMIAKHLKGMEHKSTEAMRRVKKVTK